MAVGAPVRGHSACGPLLDPLVTIHETGHALGLPDYYDYEPGNGPDGGVGGLDMMDINWGDHNVFSKWLLDWLTPQVMSAAYGARHAGGVRHRARRRSSSCPGSGRRCLPGVLHRREQAPTANNSDMPRDGLVIWHVDARLDPSRGYQDYLYDNSYTAHKLLRLMEADGLEGITAGGSADAGDYYKAGKTLGPATRPSGYAYGKAKAVVVRDIGSAGRSDRPVRLHGLGAAVHDGERRPGRLDAFACDAEPPRRRRRQRRRGTATVWTAAPGRTAPA